MELDPEACLERLESPRELTRDMDDAFQQLAVRDVREVDEDPDPQAGLGREDLRPSLMTTGADVELHLVKWDPVADGAPPLRHLVRICEGLVDERPRCVEHARDGQLRGVRVHHGSLSWVLVARPACCIRARWASRRSREVSQNRR